VSQQLKGVLNLSCGLGAHFNEVLLCSQQVVEQLSAARVGDGLVVSNHTSTLIA
jgi:hypothetical protein